MSGILLWHTDTLLHLVDQPDALIAEATGYARILVASLFPGYVFLLLRHYAAVHNRPSLGLYVILGGLPLNAALNYVLMFGHFGLPRLELAGAALATVIVYLMMAAVLFLVIHRAAAFACPLFRVALRGSDAGAPSWRSACRSAR